MTTTDLELHVVRDLSAKVAPIEYRADDDERAVLEGYFSVFNSWYEINSLWEGNFLERVAPGSFKKTMSENRANLVVLFNHGRDQTMGDKILGSISELNERQRGAWYEVDLFRGLDELILDGLRAGVYGSSFRFRVTKDEWNEEPARSDHNPDGIPERTIKEVHLYEFGPVTYPANPQATAGVRSSTDEFYEHLRAEGASLEVLSARAKDLRTLRGLEPPEGTRDIDGAAATNSNEPAEEGHSGHTKAQRERELALLNIA